MSGGQEAKRRGNLGEAAVIAYLRERGWNMVEVNFRSKYGEIDLVAEDGRYLAFVEVKLRKDDRFGSACEAVTPAKQRKLRTAAEFYLIGRPTRLQPRFDVAEVYAPQGVHTVTPDIYYIENAF